MKTAKRIQGFSDLKGNTDSICYYSQDEVWYLYFPKCGLGNLAAHEVTEHEDGTITVSPSIRMQGHQDGQPYEIHGYLEKGVWRDC